MGEVTIIGRLLPGLLLPVLLGAAAPAARTGELSFGIGGGLYDPVDEAGRNGERARFGVVLTTGYAPRSSLAIDVELLLAGASYDVSPDLPTPLLGRLDDDLRLRLTGGFVGARGVLGGERLLAPFARIGLGLVRSEMTVAGQSVGLPQQLAEEDLSPALSLAGGVRVRASRSWGLDLEARRLVASADLGELSGGDLDVGGWLFSAGIARVLPAPGKAR